MKGSRECGEVSEGSRHRSIIVELRVRGSFEREAGSEGVLREGGRE